MEQTGDHRDRGDRARLRARLDEIRRALWRLGDDHQRKRHTANFAEQIWDQCDALSAVEKELGDGPPDRRRARPHVNGTHAESLIHADDRALFTCLVRDMQGITLPAGISCHELAAQVHQRYPSLRAARGMYAGAWEHSWLVTPHQNILDVYPVGLIGGPLLIDGNAGPGPLLYREEK
jgi:hypothetical protein